ncbi:MAG: SCO family protein [Candidatus Thiodiazotropha sp. (ex Lucina pensylvanica)]|nr:SCO family protein [Candidatus Thiodiazotropha sp. (ex Lucina pensylvanica)]
MKQWRHSVLSLTLLSLGTFAPDASLINSARAENAPAQILRLYVPGFGGDFTLTDHHGNSFALQQMRGKVVVLYFGYTACADICPTTLFDVASAMRALGPKAAQVQPLMITIDPKRDTKDRLKAVLPYYHPSILGLTGSEAEIEAVEKQYRASSHIRPPDRNGFYAVDHTSHLYIIDTEGRLGYLIPFGTPAEKITAVLQELLEQVSTAQK